MANEPYKDYPFLYEYYVKRRLNLKDIQKILREQYMVDVTVQTLYNWVKKFDLLKFRGKGRNLNAHLGQSKRPQSPRERQVAEMKRRNRDLRKKRS